MQENRSFDMYFGTYKGVRGFGDRITIPLPQNRSVWEQHNGTRVVMPYHLDSKQGNAQRVSGTPHDYMDAQQAWDGGRMYQWPRYKQNQSMGYYEQQEVEFSTRWPKPSRCAMPITVPRMAAPIPTVCSTGPAPMTRWR